MDSWRICSIRVYLLGMFRYRYLSNVLRILIFKILSASSFPASRKRSLPDSR